MTLNQSKFATWTAALAAGLGIALILGTAIAADPPAKAANAPNTDDALRSKFDDDLFGDLKPSEKPAPEKKPTPVEKPPMPKPVEEKPGSADKPNVVIEGDDALRRLLNEERGEDIGAERPKNPLIEIGERMKRVRARLAAGDASPETQAEEQRIIDDIAKLMEQAQQQKKKQSSGNNNSKTASKPQPKPSDKAQKPGPMEGQGDPNTSSKKPAEESTERLGTSKNEATAAVSREVLVKKAWGHLPPRLRERLINTPLDRFLPEYEQLIEDYFRRLAEERSDSP